MARYATIVVLVILAVVIFDKGYDWINNWMCDISPYGGICAE